MADWFNPLSLFTPSHTGAWGTPEYGATERLAQLLGSPTTSQGGSNILGASTVGTQAQTQSTQPNQSPAYNPQTGQPNFQTSSTPTNQSTGGGGTISLGRGNESVGALVDKDGTTYQHLGNDQWAALRNNATQASNSALESALGVFEARKQGLLNRIPGIQQASQLRLQGLDQGLQNYLESAGLEEGNRIAGLGEQLGGIQEQYTRANRQQRVSAQALARQLRNVFAGAGTLDSTQYRDYLGEQDRSILQSLGDLRREQAGKVTANTREQEDIKQFYSQSRLAEQRRVQLAKEQEQADTDALVQRVMDDVNLTDAQKIEAVDAANARLEQRLSDLDQQELAYNQKAEQDAKEFALKSQELKSKNYSESYQSTIQQTKALEGAIAVLDNLSKQNISLTPQLAKQVFTQYGGLSDKEADYYAQFYGGGQNQSYNLPGLGL